MGKSRIKEIESAPTSRIFFFYPFVLFLFTYSTVTFASSEHYTLFQNRDHNRRAIEFMITQHGTTIASGIVMPNSEKMVRYIAEGKSTRLKLFFRYYGRKQWSNRSRLGLSRADSIPDARKNPYQIGHTDIEQTP